MLILGNLKNVLPLAWFNFIVFFFFFFLVSFCKESHPSHSGGKWKLWSIKTFVINSVRNVQLAGGLWVFFFFFFASYNGLLASCWSLWTPQNAAFKMYNIYVYKGNKLHLNIVIKVLKTNVSLMHIECKCYSDLFATAIMWNVCDTYADSNWYCYSGILK